MRRNRVKCGVVHLLQARTSPWRLPRHSLCPHAPLQSNTNNNNNHDELYISKANASEFYRRTWARSAPGTNTHRISSQGRSRGTTRLGLRLKVREELASVNGETSREPVCSEPPTPTICCSQNLSKHGIPVASSLVIQYLLRINTATW